MGSAKEELCCWDWDDTKLVAAFEKSLKAGASVKNSSKKSTKEHNTEKKEKKWNVEDFCCCLFEDDQKFYEAKITNIFRNKCTVEFLGYGNEEEVSLHSLKDSKGPAARKKQIAEAKEDLADEEEASSSEEEVEESSCTAGESCSDANTPRRRNRNASRRRKQKVAINDSHVSNYTEDGFSCHPHDQSMAYPHSYHHGPHHDTTSQWPDYSMGASYMPQMQPASHPPFPFPNFPHMHNMSSDSSLASMIASWYYAGYATGYHQGEKNRKCCCHK